MWWVRVREGVEEGWVRVERGERKGTEGGGR